MMHTHFLATLLMMAAVASPTADACAQTAQQSPAEDAFKSFRQLENTVKMPKPNAFSAIPGNNLANLSKEIQFEARLTAVGEPMQEGLVWRVFAPIAGEDGKLPLIATFEGGRVSFRLPPGEYLINCLFGRAGITRKLVVPAAGNLEKQTFVLDAGGIVLNAVAGTDQRLPADKVDFSIYSAEVKENGDRSLIIADVKANTLVRLNAGTYHVVSEYGDVNAVVRADIQVEAGKLTQVQLQHRAEQITLKLVSQPGGEAIADTAWSVLTAAGDVVSESVRAFSTMVLTEGEYLAVARNRSRIYQRNFTVQAGRNTDVEVLMRNPAEAANTAVFETDESVSMAPY